jgi:hypothetical protein
MRFAILLFVIPLLGEADTFDDLVAGTRCTQGTGQQLVCTYYVPDVLRIQITAVGEPDGRIDFLKSDIDGDYYAALGLTHGCIIVTPGNALRNREVDRFFDFAFIAPRNGKVYRAWQECQNAL